ncbi:hypothetical protein D3C78_808460 [compost metagenome]
MRVGLGVGATDAAQERADITFKRAGVGFLSADADVAGHVDRPPSGHRYIEHFHAIGVGDDVGAGRWHIDTDTHPGETDLVAFDHLFGGKGRLDGGAVAQVDTAGGVDNCSIGREPEGFVGVVGGKADRLGVIEHARRWQQRTHVRGRSRRTRHP